MKSEISQKKVIRASFIALLVLLLLGVGVFIYIKKIKEYKVVLQNDRNARAVSLKTGEFLVHITEEGFSPKKLILYKGDNKIIIFRNTSMDTVELASAYPNFSSPKLSPRSEYSFVLTDLGLWNVNIKGSPQKNINIILKK